MIASTAISSAWRSRWMTCDDTSAAFSPRRWQMRASTDGSRCANVPTAPDTFPKEIVSRACSTRSRSRCSSAYQSASFSPKVIGSAWTPCVRPIIGVCRCSSARSRTASMAPAMSFTITSQASRICSACAVSMTSEEVSPKCSQRAAGPTRSATAVVNAITSCCVVCSISSIRAMSNDAFARSSRAASPGMIPASAIASAAASSTASQVS